MKISAEEIKKIALLSRLEVKEDQMETVGKQLNDILSYMDLLSQVDVTDVKPTALPYPCPTSCATTFPSRRWPMKKRFRMRRNRLMAISKFRKSSRINREAYVC